MGREVREGTVRYDDRPSIVMFAASGVEMDDAREGVALAGCRICGEVEIDEDTAGLDDKPAADAAFLRLLQGTRPPTVCYGVWTRTRPRRVAESSWSAAPPRRSTRCSRWRRT